MNILVTGGLGYIGSHLCVELLKKKINVFVVDDLSNTSIKVKSKIEKISKKKIKFFKNNLENIESISKILKESKITIVFHLAGVKAVNESTINPYKYFKKNSFCTMNLLKAMEKSNVDNIIFSSSATVYGNENKNPIKEIGSLQPINPYGTSKLISEKIIIDFEKSIKSLNYVILRYFNPIGYHESKLLNDDNSNDNLIPNLIKSFKLNKKFKIYGKNYNTKDGTAIRDYIHIKDLISAHISSINFIKKNKSSILNVGTGKGYTVLDVIRSCEKVINKKINFKFTGRRKGDPEKIFCCSKKIKKKLNWKAKFTLLKMCSDAIQIKN